MLGACTFLLLRCGNASTNVTTGFVKMILWFAEFSGRVKQRKITPSARDMVRQLFKYRKRGAV